MSTAVKRAVFAVCVFVVLCTLVGGPFALEQYLEAKHCAEVTEAEDEFLSELPKMKSRGATTADRFAQFEKAIVLMEQNPECFDVRMRAETEAGYREFLRKSR